MSSGVIQWRIAPGGCNTRRWLSLEVPMKAESSSTADGQESIDSISQFPYWLNEPGEAPRFLGKHWQCEICGQMSSLSAEDIRHDAGCPEGDR